MSRTYGWTVLWVAASCAQPDHAAQTTLGLHRKSTTFRSAPSTFLGVPGLTQVTESTHTDDEWGYSEKSRVVVFRAGKVVCELPKDARDSHENHTNRTSAEIAMSSREPLRFHVRETSSSNEFSPSASCTGYELLDTGSCRKLFEHSCTKNECKLTYKASVVSGIGIIRGQITEDRKPLPGITVAVESHVAISDEHGAFLIDAGAGAHEIVLGGVGDVRDPKAAVSLEPKQDAEVVIAVECRMAENEQPCCAP